MEQVGRVEAGIGVEEEEGVAGRPLRSSIHLRAAALSRRQAMDAEAFSDSQSSIAGTAVSDNDFECDPLLSAEIG